MRATRDVVLLGAALALFLPPAAWSSGVSVATTPTIRPIRIAHYSRLPQVIWETIGPHFGIEFTTEEIDVMRAEARFSSKKTDASEFRPESDSKLEEATPAMKRLAERFVGPVIEDLKRLPQA